MPKLQFGSSKATKKTQNRHDPQVTPEWFSVDSAGSPVAVGSWLMVDMQLLPWFSA